jgi:protoporphyrinogen oxidase
MKVLIIGNGIAGQAAAFHYRGHDVAIIDPRGAQHPLVGHSAVMRTKSNEIGLYLNTEMEKIWVEKAVYRSGKLYSQPTLLDRNQYSLKTTGRIDQRSISSLSSGERFVFKESLNYKSLGMVVNDEVHAIENKRVKLAGDVVWDEYQFDICISTAPMPVNMRLCGLQRDVSFTEERIDVLRGEIGVDSSVYQTVYLPDPDEMFNRISLHRKTIIAESSAGHMVSMFSDDELGRLLALKVEKIFGIGTNLIKNVRRAEQKAGKISEIDDIARKEIIMELSHKHGVYSLGRYACWRPKLMADDLPKDIKRIDDIYNTNYIGRIYESHNY